MPEDLKVVVPVTVTIRWKKGGRALEDSGVVKNERENAEFMVKEALDRFEPPFGEMFSESGNPDDPTSIRFHVGKAKRVEVE